MFRRHNARPTVKKVSTLVDKRSHKQRKYISLMLVPSYSSGRTRSLRIPRVVFYCIIFTVIAVAAVTAGLYLRSERFADQYRSTREYLYDTQDELAMFRALSEDEQARLMELYAGIYAQLTEEQHMARIEQNLIRQAQQDELNSLLEILDELEQRIFEFDYERFAEEVISPLRSGEPFAYRPYDCQTGALSAPVFAAPHPLNVIEGVYSLHPHFAGVYDITVFMRTGQAEQRRRLLERNANLYERFAREWIPMENRYFDFFNVPGKCDFVFDAGVQNDFKMGELRESCDN